MQKYLIIHDISNSYGKGYEIRAEVFSGDECKEFRTITYYYYSKANAIKDYRKSIHAEGQHFKVIEFK